MVSRSRLLIFVCLAGLCTLVVPASVMAFVSARVIDSPQDLLEGTAAAGQPGDILIENEHIAVVISAVGHRVDEGLNGGTIIDAGTAAWRQDALAELYTYFADSWPRQARAGSLQILADGRDGVARVRVHGSDSQDPAVAVTTDYVLADGWRYLAMETTLDNQGDLDNPAFELGDAISWGDCGTFAPGSGFDLNGYSVNPWVVGLTDDVAYGYIGSDGDLWGDHGSGWSDLNVTSAALTPGVSVSYTRWLAVGRGVAEVAAVLHELSGQAVGDLAVTVRSRETQRMIDGATVELAASDGAPYLQLSTGADGQAGTTLPAGSWTLRTAASGFLPNERDVQVSEGSSTRLTILLDRRDDEGALGDPITVVQRPLPNIPAFVRGGSPLNIYCEAPASTTGWQASLVHDHRIVELPVVTTSLDESTGWWTVQVGTPADLTEDLYDLRVVADGGLEDTVRNAVRILDDYRREFYFVHITDTHLPDHRFSADGGSPEDDSETRDLLEVVADVNLINPEFVLLTGDVVNEGELEDYRDWRSFSRAQEALAEFDVPVFIVSGNHDIGGWDNTPPPDGTARRDWWRFFGWPRLADPPPGAPARTQDYSFDYGPIHFVGLESYINYDGWRSSDYGNTSFTFDQMEWLQQDLLDASGSETQVLFYHYDFADEIDLRDLGVEMALSGHTHRDQGSLGGPPWNLGTRALCDGKRAYRLIRVSDGQLDPRPTLAAGSDGGMLRVQWGAIDDGRARTATITNQHAERFENARLQFEMPSGTRDFTVTGGVIEQVDSSGDDVVVTVEFELPAQTTAIVTVTAGCTARDTVPCSLGRPIVAP